VLDALTAQPPHLPPDWAVVDATGREPRAQSSPAGDPARYGYEAARVSIQAAVDCRASGQDVAVRAWPFLAAEVDGGDLVATYTLDGQPLGSERHPLALVAAAAAAAASGDHQRAADLLDAADNLDAEAPTYFGAAWIALGRLWLDTDVLGGCRPGSPTLP
jgi:endoglucanase